MPPARHPDDLVTVYSFRSFDLSAGDMVHGNYKTTRAAIQAMARGEVLEGTAETVPRSALDAQGRFRRVATGWGELA